LEPFLLPKPRCLCPTGQHANSFALHLFNGGLRRFVAQRSVLGRGNGSGW
jgi:hypothetical protein